MKICGPEKPALRRTILRRSGHWPEFAWPCPLPCGGSCSPFWRTDGNWLLCRPAPSPWKVVSVDHEQGAISKGQAARGSFAYHNVDCLLDVGVRYQPAQLALSWWSPQRVPGAEPAPGIRRISIVATHPETALCPSRNISTMARSLRVAVRKARSEAFRTA